MNGDVLKNWAERQNPAVPKQIQDVLIANLGKLPPEKAAAIVTEIDKGNLPMMKAVELIRKGAGAPASGPTPEKAPQPEKQVVGKVPPESATPGKVVAGEAPKPKKSGFPFAKGNQGAAKPASKGKNPMMLIVVAVVAVVILAAAVLLVPKFVGGNDDPSFTVPNEVTPTEIVPGGADQVADQGLTNLDPESKSEWATQVLDSTLGDPALKRPASFKDALTNFPILWLVYFLGAPVLLFMIYRDRSQAQEMSDIKLANRGFWFMFLAVVFAEMIAGVLLGKVFTNETVGVMTVLVVGAIGAIAFQWSAVTSGKRDYSVLAIGVYSSGLLIKWWLSADPTLSAIATGLMILGMFLMIIEIRRNEKDTDSDSVMWKSLLGTALMILIFLVVFGFMFVTIQNAIGNMPIPVDVEAQAKAATQLAIYSKGQMPISIGLGAIAAIMAGWIWGALALKPATSKNSGKVVDGNILGLVSLDADMLALFVMLLWFAMPWMSLLPKLILLFL